MKQKDILAIIPARGTSIRLPGKNVKLLAGKPLIFYTIEAAKSSIYLSRIVVATDDDDISKVARQYGVEVIINPTRLHTGDEQGIINVTNHTLLYLERYEAYKPLIVVILQPTSPLRTVEDIDSTLKLIFDSGTASAETQCQGKENGAVYISRRQVFIEQHKILGDSVAIYEMPPERSVDIDTQEDFDLAEQLLNGGQLDNSGVLHKLAGLGRSQKDDSIRKGRRGRPRKVPTI